MLCYVEGYVEIMEEYIDQDATWRSIIVEARILVGDVATYCYEGASFIFYYLVISLQFIELMLIKVLFVCEISYWNYYWNIVNINTR